MTLETAYTTAEDVQTIASELRSKIQHTPRFLLFFASSRHDPTRLGAALEAAFEGVPSIGCTSAGEIVTGKMLNQSVVAFSMDDDVLASVDVARAPVAHAPQSVTKALEQVTASISSPVHAIDPGKYVGLVLHDGLSGAEEVVMSALSTATNVPFIGGSAGDDRSFQQTHVFINFKPIVGHSVIALLQPKRSYRILKTQSFDILDKTLHVTDADEKSRTVRAFNGKPAAEEYARAIGVTVSELADHFHRYPVGLVVDQKEPYVRSPQQVRGTDVVFYCQIKEGMQLKILSARDIVEDTRKDLKTQLDELGTCQGIINFNCILRTIELERKGQCEAYGQLFSKVPTIGFSTYGESYIGHINQTSTMLLFS